MDADQAGRQAVVGALMEAIAKLSGTAVTSAVPNPSESSSIGIMSRIGTTATCMNSGFRSSSGNTSLQYDKPQVSHYDVAPSSYESSRPPTSTRII